MNIKPRQNLRRAEDALAAFSCGGPSWRSCASKAGGMGTITFSPRSSASSNRASFIEALGSAIGRCVESSASAKSRPSSPWRTTPTTQWRSPRKSSPATSACAGLTRRSSRNGLNGRQQTIGDAIERAAAELADPKNQPVYFHCHHGINRASLVQMAYRMLYCGWDLDQALAEIKTTVGLVPVHHGVDFHYMKEFYETRVLPKRRATASKPLSERAR